MGGLVFDRGNGRRSTAMAQSGGAVRGRKIVREALASLARRADSRRGLRARLHCAELLEEGRVVGRLVGVDSSAAMLALAGPALRRGHLPPNG